MPNEIQPFSVPDIQAMAQSVAREDGLDEHQAAVMLWLAQAEGHSLKLAVEFLKSIKPDTTGCWHYTGSITPNGYGKFYMGDRKSPAGNREPEGSHRASYRLFFGPIPPGLVIHHLCEARSCVKPLHLEPTTQRDNILRGEGMSARYAKQTACKHGHLKTAENTYFWKGKPHGCLPCMQARDEAKASKNSHQKGVQ